MLVLCGAATVFAVAVWLANASDGDQRSPRAEVTAPAFDPVLDVLFGRAAIAAAAVNAPAADHGLDVLFGRTAIAAGEASAAGTPLADPGLDVLFGRAAIAAGEAQRS